MQGGSDVGDDVGEGDTRDLGWTARQGGPRSQHVHPHRRVVAWGWRPRHCCRGRRAGPLLSLDLRWEYREDPRGGWRESWRTGGGGPGGNPPPREKGWGGEKGGRGFSRW